MKRGTIAAQDPAPATTYSRILQSLQTGPLSSTSPSRKGQRINAALQVTNLTVQASLQMMGRDYPERLASITATSFILLINSGYAALHTDTQPNEKFTHALQAIFSALIFGISIALIFKDEELLKTLLYLFVSLSNALLLVTWGASEYSKAKTTTTTTGEDTHPSLRKTSFELAEIDEEKGEMSEEEDENEKAGNSVKNN